MREEIDTLERATGDMESLKGQDSIRAGAAISVRHSSLAPQGQGQFFIPDVVQEG